MPWQFSEDVEAYAERVLPLLSARPEAYTIGLSVIATLRAGHPFSGAPPLFGWLEEGGEVRGAISQTPPFDLLLSVVPDAADLAAALRERGSPVSGANGESDLVDRFAAAWTVGSDLEARTWLQLRQFALGALEPPDPPPAGRARPAAHDDFERAQAWFDAFSEELELPDRMQESHVRQQIDERMLWLWDDAAGETAALALRTPAATGVARVNCVYTPPERRGHGYAGAVTAACCADALARDAERVVLFTDLDNPAPNKVYQRIGFHPIADHRVVKFRVLDAA